MSQPEPDPEPPIPFPGTPAAPAVDANEVNLAVIKSPIVGTFYRSSEPGAKAFVEVGDIVKKGQVLFRIDPRPFEVALRTAEAQREQAVAQLAFADAEVDRTQPLADKGYASEQRFQQLESNRQVARSRVQEAEAAIARQKLNLDYAVIRAPFDGRSSLSDVNVGDHVNENTTQLVSVVQVDPIEVQVALSSEDSEAVRAALKENRAFIQIGRASCRERV